MAERGLDLAGKVSYHDSIELVVTERMKRLCGNLSTTPLSLLSVPEEYCREETTLVFHKGRASFASEISMVEKNIMLECWREDTENLCNQYSDSFIQLSATAHVKEWKLIPIRKVAHQGNVYSPKEET